jgi:hypothetical protein
MHYTKDYAIYALFHLPLTNAISMIRNTMIEDIKKYYVQDSSSLKNLMKSYIKMAKTIKKTQKYTAYTLDNGVLCYDIKVSISNFEYFHVHILYDCHDIPIVGHPMFHKTYVVVKKKYFLQVA